MRVLVSLSDDQSQQVGTVTEVHCARTVTDRVDRHVRHRNEGIDHGFEDGCTRGGGQFRINWHIDEGNTLEKFSRTRGRHLTNAVVDLDLPPTGRNLAA